LDPFPVDGRGDARRSRERLDAHSVPDEPPNQK
jgi:hypothetical protein